MNGTLTSTKRGGTMASVDDKATVDQMIANNGEPEDDNDNDPPITHVIEYGNMFDGRTAYSLAYSEKQFKYQWEAGNFAWKRLYWSQKEGTR